VKYIRRGLDLLLEIQRTGDIFLPRNWMAALLYGHNSQAVAEIVRTFLDEHPHYPVRLRRIILQAADPVFRAANYAYDVGTISGGNP
jgi:aminopeptidase N